VVEREANVFGGDEISHPVKAIAEDLLGVPSSRRSAS
jgi:hypothetical protein